MLPGSRMLNLLGLAARAGRVVAGTDAVRRALRQNSGVAIVLLAGDSSPTQQAKLVPLLEALGVSYHRVSERARLGAAIGRASVSAVAVTDPQFAAQIAALIRSNSFAFE